MKRQKIGQIEENLWNLEESKDDCRFGDPKILRSFKGFENNTPRCFALRQRLKVVVRLQIILSLSDRVPQY